MAAGQVTCDKPFRHSCLKEKPLRTAAPIKVAAQKTCALQTCCQKDGQALPSPRSSFDTFSILFNPFYAFSFSTSRRPLRTREHFAGLNFDPKSLFIVFCTDHVSLTPNSTSAAPGDASRCLFKALPGLPSLGMPDPRRPDALRRWRKVRAHAVHEDHRLRPSAVPCDMWHVIVGSKLKTC